MAELNRHDLARRESTRDQLKAMHKHVLAAAGEARLAAMQEATTELERIADLLPGALESGLSLAEISRITGVSRPTLYELQRESTATPDRGIQLLAALVAGGAQTIEELGESLD